MGDCTILLWTTVLTVLLGYRHLLPSVLFHMIFRQLFDVPHFIVHRVARSLRSTGVVSLVRMCALLGQARVLRRGWLMLGVLVLVVMCNQEVLFTDEHKVLLVVLWLTRTEYVIDSRDWLHDVRSIPGARMVNR